jgi:uncharacterized membrane protein
MTLFQAVLVLATFLCSLTAGFLFAFAAVVMPGIRRLEDGAFIRAFQAIDGVIQNSQPLFLVMWVGSVLSVVAAAVIGIWKLGGPDRLLVIVAALVYVVGVQVPTMVVNIPLNNTLQRLEPATMSESTRESARRVFEPRWNRWNVFRTVCASLVALLLMFLLLRNEPTSAVATVVSATASDVRSSHRDEGAT